MGIGGISVWQVLIVLLIIILIFGTKKLSTMGTDAGSAVKGLRKAMGKLGDNPTKSSESSKSKIDSSSSAS